VPSNLVKTLQALEPVLRSQGRLIRLRPDRRIVFVGDTHGDIEGTERVLSRFREPKTTLVFLGDTVDRGPHSRQNLEHILRAKLETPEAVYLLMGNHEGWGVARFTPADFWLGLSHEEEQDLASGLLQLPYAAWHPGRLLATHGAIPDLGSLDELSRIVPGSPAWRDLVWGDWSSRDGSPRAAWSGRPTFDPSEFERRTKRLGVNVLVRAHQPSAPTYLYNERCLTLFTSSAYAEIERRVAVLGPTFGVESARDLELIAL
jgi:hypothetical protein